MGQIFVIIEEQIKSMVGRKFKMFRNGNDEKLKDIFCFGWLFILNGIYIQLQCGGF